MKTTSMLLLSAVLTLSTAAFAQPARARNTDTPAKTDASAAIHDAPTKADLKAQHEAEKRQEKYTKEELKAHRREQKATLASEKRSGITRLSN